MNALSDNLGHAWNQVQAGWNNLVTRASDALTRFTQGEEESDEDARSLLRRSPNWGLLAAEMRETGSEIRVRLEVPGLDPDKLEIEVHGRVLRIAGEKHVQRETERGRYHVTECAYGRFSRQLALPRDVDTSQTRAEYHNGVLQVRLPKTVAAQAKRIHIQRG